MTATNPKKKFLHPWRSFSPGWLKRESDKQRADRIIPLHARPIKG